MCKHNFVMIESLRLCRGFLRQHLSHIDSTATRNLFVSGENSGEGKAFFPRRFNRGSRSIQRRET